MALYIALFAAVLPAVFAMPQHAHMGHGPYKGRSLPSGFPTGFPQPSVIPGSAPFPVGGNGTVGAPTATGAPPSTPVTIQSTLNIIPLPASSGPGGIGSSPTSGAGGIDSSPASGSGGTGESGAACGPSTITITKANTVTVTVPAPSGGSGGAPSEAPVQSSAAVSSPVLAPSSAPFALGNSGVPAGPAGTSTVGIGLPSLPYQAPIVSSTPVSSTPVSPASVSLGPVSSTPASSTPVVAQTSGVGNYPASVPVNSAAVQAYSAPAQAATSAASSTSSPTSSVVAPELLHVPGGEQGPPAPVIPASITPASVTPSVTPAVARSVTPASPSAAPVGSNGKARGLLYGGNNGQMAPAQALSAANSFLSASNGAVGWCWNWDSSPSPAIGSATGSTNVEFVPMLWGLGGHVKIWSTNVATVKPTYAMGFNEPDMTTDKGGSQLSVADAVKGWKDNMEPLKSSGIKLVSPGTTNDITDSNMGHGYMSQFLEACTGCHFDVLTFHYYGEASDVQALQATVAKYRSLQKLHNIGELWISEMAPNEPPTTEQMAAFLKFLDNPSNGVARYAFNGLNTGNGQSLAGPVIRPAYQS